MINCRDAKLQRNKIYLTSTSALRLRGKKVIVLALPLYDTPVSMPGFRATG